MLDQSVVISKGYGGTLILSRASPDRIIDGSTGGATAKVIAGSVLNCLVDNTFAPSTAWSAVAVGSSVVVPAGKRTAIRDGGGPGGSVVAAPVWS